MLHSRYGHEYIDENPITGQPGAFHLASTGRVPDKKLALHSNSQLPPISTGGLSGAAGAAEKKDGKDNVGPSSAKTPKTPSGGSAPAKLKRRKSKVNASQ